MNKKRVLSAVLAMVMLIAMLPTAVMAAGAVGVTAGNAEIDQGTTSASVQINVSNNPGIAILGFDIGYEAAQMSISSVVVGDVFTNGDVTAGDTSKNPYTFSAMKLENVSTNGNLVTINFTVKADCPAGTYPITLSAAEAYTIDEDEVAVTLTNGSVVVKSAEPEPTELKGTVTVKGTATYGNTLTANTSALNYNGAEKGTLTYQWKRNGVNISGATAAAYQLTAADIGKTITVTVTNSNNIGSVTSAGVGPVVKAAGPAAPSGLSTVKPSAEGKSDGKIVGTTAAMEYANNASFNNAKTCNAGETTGLAAGTYYVRVKETATNLAGAAATVKVPAGDPVVTSYSVTVNGSYAANSGAGTYQTGATVTVRAGSREGYTFDGWTSADVTITNAKKETATFTMPNKAVTVTANWKKNPEEPTHTHDFDNKWESDGTYHWHECKNQPCEEVDSKERHTAGQWKVEIEATETKNGKRCKYCTVCNKLLETEIIPATGDDDDSRPGWGGLFPLLLGGSSSSKDFSDVTMADWFYEDVEFATGQGLMNGVGDNRFDPNGVTTRAMIVTILYRLEGEPVVHGTKSFADVAADSWYADAVAWAADAGVVYGYNNGNFGANDPITREQLAAILYRYAEYHGCDMSTSSDINGYKDGKQVSTYAVPAMQWACGEYLLNGSNGNLQPGGYALRCQVAAILHRFLNNVFWY